MATRTYLVLLVLVQQWTLMNLASASDELIVELASDKTEYVLGETVVLQVAVHNEGDQDLPVWVDKLADEIQIFLGSPGDAVPELEIGSEVIWEVIPSTVPLRKGEWKHYALRLLYSFGPWTTEKRASTLAFPEAGEYTIHVRYPLAPKRKMFNSSTIKILVKRPQGIDAEVWRELNHEPTLLFLQHGEHATQELACAIAEILIRIPDSAYHPAMRWALGRYYYRLRNAGPIVPNPEDIENGKLLRKALGIVLQHPSDRWERAIPDERLYVRRVVYALPEPTPLDEVFALATRQTGVPLIVDASINKRGSFSALKSDKSLADFMRFFTIPGDSTWIRDGWGYRLVSVKEADGGGEEQKERE